MKSILTIIGTRPEAIKLAPFLQAVTSSKRLASKVCITRQHADLVESFLSDCKISTDFQLERDKKGGGLHQNAAHFLKQFSPILKKAKPDVVLVQGDTTSAFTGALAAFYAQIPVAHLEAGLRTGCFHSPWPEEAHRCLIDRLATYFFTPTEQAKNQLLSEGISNEKIWVVGNTSIDALRLLRKEINPSKNTHLPFFVVTIHRRENHGEPLKEICHALYSISQQFPEIRIHFVLHPNPSVRTFVMEKLSGISNIDLMDPMDHSSFIQHLDKSLFLVTDSGGIQEEAPFMGKPVLIVRDTTERPEGVQAGTARLVGTKTSNIISCCKELLENPETLRSMSKVHFPYGDGYAAEKIVAILEQELK